MILTILIAVIAWTFCGAWLPAVYASADSCLMKAASCLKAKQYATEQIADKDKLLY